MTVYAVLLCQKPVCGTYASNCLEQRCGGLWIDGGRVEGGKRMSSIKDFSAIHGNRWGSGAYLPKIGEKEVQGRWPANVVLEGSENVVAELEGKASGRGHFPKHPKAVTKVAYGKFNPSTMVEREMPDGGDLSAARFFRKFGVKA